jgi:hypothetical protein
MSHLLDVYYMYYYNTLPFLTITSRERVDGVVHSIDPAPSYGGDMERA